MSVDIGRDTADSEALASRKSREVPPVKVFDRSSFVGDFLIKIPDQTAEDFELYAPEHQICEYSGGTIYMPSPVSNKHQDLVLFLLDLLNGHRLRRGTGRASGLPPSFCGVLRVTNSPYELKIAPHFNGGRLLAARSD